MERLIPIKKYCVFGQKVVKKPQCVQIVSHGALIKGGVIYARIRYLDLFKTLIGSESGDISAQMLIKHLQIFTSFQEKKKNFENLTNFGGFICNCYVGFAHPIFDSFQRPCKLKIAFSTIFSLLNILCKALSTNDVFSSFTQYQKLSTSFYAFFMTSEYLKMHEHI